MGIMTSSTGYGSALIVFLVCLLPLIVSSVGFDQSCISGHHHKAVPGAEDLSTTKCAAWSKQSCCTKETALKIDANATDGTWLNFDWNHCKDKPLSAKCRNHFVEDLCFYECSPNSGPWIVDELPHKKIRKSRFRDIPLCKSDCDTWFEDCKDDFTCTDNWATNFNWTGGSNSCPADSACRRFKEVFVSSKEFCENIFDHSFKYSVDSQPCMKMSFNSTQENLNDQVEKWQKNMQTYLNSYDSNAAIPKTVPFLAISVLPTLLWLSRITA